jgi:ATP-binding cassette, subfamily B, bacterial MsbA
MTSEYNKLDSQGLSLLTRLIKTYVKPYYMRLVVAMFSMIIVAGATGMHAYLVQPMLDQIFMNKNISMLYTITFLVFGISIIKGIATYFQTIQMKYIGQRIIADMQIDLYQHLLHCDLAFLHNFSSGKLISRFTNDIVIMRAAVSNILTGFIREILSVIFLTGVMIYQNWELTLVSIIVYPFAILPVIRLGKRMRKVAHMTQESLGNYTSQLDDTFQNIRVVKSFQNEDYEVSHATKTINGIFDLYMKAAKIESISSPIMETFSGVAIAIVIWYGGTQVINGETTAGGFFSFIAAMIMAYKPVKSLADLNTSLQEGLAAAKRYFTLIDTKPNILNAPNAYNIKIRKGDISFNNVNFAYQNNKNVLSNFSLNIKAGQTVAFVGTSGGGKSTIANLILRFYDAQTGNILIDDQDIKNVTLESLRKQIAIVTQDTILFDDTIIENIRYGKLDASDDEIIQATKFAAAYDFIDNAPNGFDTMVGQHGVRLSGGQKQRISIARAILKDAPIMILDEATSALDNISEHMIQIALKKLRKDKTTIIVAHRLSTIIDADVIYVLDHGVIIEAGTHSQLIDQNGAYAKLYQKQKSTH